MVKEYKVINLNTLSKSK